MEDFAQKREWFLSGRAIPDGRSRTRARLDAIAQADVLGAVTLESLDPGVRHYAPAPAWSRTIAGSLRRDRCHGGCPPRRCSRDPSR